MRTKATQHRHFNSSGSALVLVLVISVIGLILSTSIWGYVNSLTLLVLKTNHSDSFRTVMNSAVDYTINGIRNRWCFTSTWTQNSSCSLTDINSVERLLISDEALRTIEAGMPPASYGGVISNVRTKSITASVTFSNIVPGHPLYYAVTGLQDFGQNFVLTFTITRMDDGLAKGREVALQVKVDLDTVTPLFGNQDNVLTVVSTVMVFPREINTNALLVANNLFLDRADPGVAVANPGDVYIPMQTSSGVPGIRFESPVFVNNNIYVPSELATGYTPVTFVDKVIVGGGAVLTQAGSTANFYSPLTAGESMDRYYSQSAVFGGFLNGVLLDPAADKGLSTFAGVVAVTPPSYADANLCIRRNNAKVELSVTRDSQLFIKLDSAATVEALASAVTDVNSTYSFVADLGSVDSFYAQGNIGAANQAKIYSPSELSPTLTYDSAVLSDQRPIMRAQIAINGWNQLPGAYVSVDLARQSTVEIPMNPTDAAAKIKITTTPVIIDTHVQAQAINVKVELLKQEAFNIRPYAVLMGSSTVTTSIEGSIVVSLEAFDVGYVTETSGIKSTRVKGSPGAPLTSSECPVGSDGYTNDIGQFGGVTYHCYSKFAWHPEMAKYKTNGFKFARAPGGADKRFVFSRNSAATGNGGYFTCPKFDNSCVVYDNNSAPMNIDLVAFDSTCNAPPAGTDLFPPFAAADWSSTSFLDQTRHSWGFTETGTEAVPGYNPGTLMIDGSFARLDVGVYPTFVTSAIYNICRIKNTANFVAGFFVCDNLIIDDGRTEPLRIIGTFIVGHMSVSPTALQMGIRWSNIYHPSAVYELRNAHILSTNMSGESCDSPATPLWQPFPSIQGAQFLYKCNPVSLRSKADPFKWTLVDPDCGVVGAEQKCKNRVMRYDILELRRQEYL